MRLVDTAGQERYSSLAPIELKKCSAVVLVFDITDQQSFDGLDEWLTVAKNSCPQDCLYYLCSNKIDLEADRFVPKELAQKFVQDNHLDGFYQTSALNGTNVMELTKAVVNLLDKRRLK